MLTATDLRVKNPNTLEEAPLRIPHCGLLLLLLQHAPPTEEIFHEPHRTD